MNQNTSTYTSPWPRLTWCGSLPVVTLRRALTTWQIPWCRRATWAAWAKLSSASSWKPAWVAICMFWPPSPTIKTGAWVGGSWPITPWHPIRCPSLSKYRQVWRFPPLLLSSLVPSVPSLVPSSSPCWIQGVSLRRQRSGVLWRRPWNDSGASPQCKCSWAWWSQLRQLQVQVVDWLKAMFSWALKPQKLQLRSWRSWMWWKLGSQSPLTWPRPWSWWTRKSLQVFPMNLPLPSQKFQASQLKYGNHRHHRLKMKSLPCGLEWPLAPQQSCSSWVLSFVPTPFTSCLASLWKTRCIMYILKVAKVSQCLSVLRLSLQRFRFGAPLPFQRGHRCSLPCPCERRLRKLEFQCSRLTALDAPKTGAEHRDAVRRSGDLCMSCFNLFQGHTWFPFLAAAKSIRGTRCWRAARDSDAQQVASACVVLTRRWKNPPDPSTLMRVRKIYARATWSAWSAWLLWFVALGVANFVLLLVGDCNVFCDVLCFELPGGEKSPIFS